MNDVLDQGKNILDKILSNRFQINSEDLSLSDCIKITNLLDENNKLKEELSYYKNYSNTLGRSIRETKDFIFLLDNFFNKSNFFNTCDIDDFTKIGIKTQIDKFTKYYSPNIKNYLETLENFDEILKKNKNEAKL